MIEVIKRLVVKSGEVVEYGSSGTKITEVIKRLVVKSGEVVEYGSSGTKITELRFEGGRLYLGGDVVVERFHVDNPDNIETWDGSIMYDDDNEHLLGSVEIEPTVTIPLPKNYDLVENNPLQ
jgi:hypothetical protein